MAEIRFIGIDNDYILFILDEDFLKSGRTSLEIRVGSYSVRATLWVYLDNFRSLYNELNQMYLAMKGTTYFCNPDEEFEVNFGFNKRGYVIINGKYKESVNKSNKLNFEFEITQPQLFDAMCSIKKVIQI